MANEEHLSVLQEGVQQWNAWREANPEVHPDLRQADLHEADLSGVNLSKTVLIGADLHGARLQGANLAGANLRRADLREADFQGADLHRAILAKTDLRDANLKEADIREADMREARLPGAVLDGADLKGAVLNKDGFRYVCMHNDRLPAGGAGATAEAPSASSMPTANGSMPADARSAAPAAPGTATKRPGLKLALAGGGVLLALGVAGLLSTRAGREADERVSQHVSKAVSTAVGENSGVDSVEIDGAALVLRSARERVEGGMYLSLLKTACQALHEMESPSGLSEIRITNQSRQEGWVYGAPEKCGEILTKPPAMTALSIAAHTKPIRKQ